MAIDGFVSGRKALYRNWTLDDYLDKTRWVDGPNNAYFCVKNVHMDVGVGQNRSKLYPSIECTKMMIISATVSNPKGGLKYYSSTIADGKTLV